MPQLMLRVADMDALTAARPDDSAIAALGARDGWLGVSLYVLTHAGAGRVSAHVRHFAPLLGVPEDPVTGSAAAALGACLASAGLAGPDGGLEMRVSQGVAPARGGEMAVRVRTDRSGAARVLHRRAGRPPVRGAFRRRLTPPGGALGARLAVLEDEGADR